MIRLFWKIFIGFWLATIVILAGTAWVMHELEPSNFPRPPRAPLFSKDPEAMRLLHFATRDAVNATEREFTERIRTLPHWARRNVFVLDSQGFEIFDRELPSPVADLMRKLDLDRPFKKLERKNRTYYGRLIQLEDGQYVRMVVAAHDGQRNMLLQMFLLNLWPVLLMAVLVSGSVCYLMARYLTRPVEALKQATRRVAAGDFDYRVSPQMPRGKDEMSSLAIDFDLMTEQLQSARAAQDRLIKDVSHELRSPLMRLQFALGLAQQHAGEAANDHINKARQAADYLNNIISDILSLPVNPTDEWPRDDVVDLVPLLSGLMEEFMPQASAKTIQLTFDHGSFKEALVDTRSNTLVGVFDNILTNAIRHTPKGGRIHIDLQEQKNQWQITLEDSGPGVADSELDKLFTPFFRTDEARDRMSGGVGLGLSIARRTVELHDGAISAHRAKLGGLALRICLPRSRVPD
ncbi:ATP-binding protein [Simiduia agarivorans]|uniref:histidine kinase n=1 Tax=Simiduia agarivorans (strain DSM 21679 / JCM 13881 / BCRC 17597 / SA1) TaxID=1117647 RepID=K4KEM7_SIMAS|nr:ATP-binding protein [Simiduia agarivorans]AFU97386.1 abfS arabinofuranosidase two component system sensor protein [Simiduia agarivorans SA1 = DSM 21679]